MPVKLQIKLWSLVLRALAMILSTNWNANQSDLHLKWALDYSSAFRELDEAREATGSNF